MKKRLIYALIAIALVFFVTSITIFIKHKPTKEKEPAQPQEIQTTEAPTENAEPQLLKLKVFYYTEGSEYMMPLSYEMESKPVREELIKAYIELILRGEEKYISPVPEGVHLRTAFFEPRKGMLIVDFSEELVNNFPGGSQAELEFIYYVVDNLCFNFEEVKMVKILVAGNEYQTLSGHIDIANPFFPDFSLLRDK